MRTNIPMMSSELFLHFSPPFQKSWLGPVHIYIYIVIPDNIMVLNVNYLLGKSAIMVFIQWILCETKNAENDFVPTIKKIYNSSQYPRIHMSSMVPLLHWNPKPQSLPLAISAGYC